MKWSHGIIAGTEVYYNYITACNYKVWPDWNFQTKAMPWGKNSTEVREDDPFREAGSF